LDLTEYSTREEIKEKYRVAILKYHPDKGGSAEILKTIIYNQETTGEYQ
jgi:curved DNA-binding protein CbpA